MIFNFTENYKFTTRLQMNNENIEVVKQAKLLGVIISDDLKWDENTKYLVKKAYSRMELLRKVASFTNSLEDKKNIYVLFIRSILEQASVVWSSSLSLENSDDLERVQKSAVRIILGKDFIDYEKALEKVDLESLKERRQTLSKKFAKKCLENEKTSDMFQVREKIHAMNVRKEEHFKVNFANTKRLKISAIPSMQRILNTDFEETQLRKRRRLG